MPRRKKRGNFNLILIISVVAVGAWIAADFWFNVYRAPKKEVAIEEIATDFGNKDQKLAAKEETVPVLEDGFKTETYRDDRYGFEFKYPVTTVADARCPNLEKTEDGFSMGMFSLVVGAAQGSLADYAERQLEGMEIEKRESLTVAGQTAAKVDYQAPGMGRYGSSVFVERGGKIFEFGLLAGEVPDACGGVDDYEDRVYQSVVSTLKFAD
jgi:hypothetical protein